MAEAKVKKVVKSAKAVKPTKKVAAEKVVAKELPKETGLKLSVYNLKGESAGTIELPKEIFGATVNKGLVAQAVRVFLANQRRGTLKTKSRGEVNISTRKIYKQKGTGRARHGAASAPIFVGGGIAFGPKQRDFSLKLSQKMKQKALISALSSKIKEGEILIVDGLEKIEPKTKKMADVLFSLGLNKKIMNSKKQTLLVVPTLDKNGSENVSKAGRNIEGLIINGASLLNTYQVLNNRRIIFMKEALTNLKEALIK
jgi:large subunit ribosomal protein L4